MQANYVQRLRLTFGKDGPARYIGHLDLAKSLERAFIRAEIPLAYTQGFNPRPRMQIASALPLGFTSNCELADIWLARFVDPDDAFDRISTATAPGIPILELRDVALKEPPLQTITTEATYSADVGSSISKDELQERIDGLLSLNHIMRERRAKDYDLRPMIFNLSCHQLDDENIMLTMRLSHQPERVARPDEVLLALNLDPASALICRTELTLVESHRHDPNKAPDQ